MIINWLKGWKDFCNNKENKEKKEAKMNKVIVRQLEEFIEKLRKGIFKMTSIDFKAGTNEIAPTYIAGVGYRNFTRSFEDSLNINYIGCKGDEKGLEQKREYYKTIFFDRESSPFAENIGRMKFPFWCWYYETGSTVKHLGEVFKINDKLFCLMKVNKQIKEGSNLVDYSEDLFHLVAKRHIVVCKGKSIIWE